MQVLTPGLFNNLISSSQCTGVGVCVWGGGLEKRVDLIYLKACFLEKEDKWQQALGLKER